MAFPLNRIDPDSQSLALGQGKQNAAERGETPASFGYDQGSPAKTPGEEFGRPRFAMDVFKGLGVEGEFGRMTNDKSNPQVQDNLKMFMAQYTNGMFSPIPPAQPPIA